MISSPVGRLLIEQEDDALIRIQMEGGKDFSSDELQYEQEEEQPLPAELRKTIAWLQSYFCKERPDPALLKLNPKGSNFARTVWEILLDIPYGETLTYRQVADEAARRLKKDRMSAQAVGTAIGKNPIPIIIPCHRVIGSGHRLGGYTPGIDKKAALLELEGINTDELKKQNSAR